MVSYKTLLSLGLSAVIGAFSAHAESRMQKFYNESIRRDNIALEQKVAGSYDPALIRQITPKVVENPDYPRENSEGMGLCIEWDPQVLSNECVIQKTIPSDFLSDKTDLYFSLQSDGQGGWLSLRFLEQDGDWWLKGYDALDRPGQSSYNTPINELERASWSTGDGIFNPENINTYLISFVAAQGIHTPGQRNIRINNITFTGIQNYIEDFSQALETLSWRKWGGEAGTIDVTNIHNPCTIWVTNNSAVSSYKNGLFTESRLVGEGRDTAELADVVDTRATYGYRSSAKPPRFVPIIDYSSYGENPLFSFIGQMVPGTNVQYTDPILPAVWLVDTKDIDGDGTLDTIPALTTIDFTKFMSINWPRERYMSAIEKARTGTEGIDYERLSGEIAVPTKDFLGIVKVTGDVLHAYPGAIGININAGTIFVMTAKQSDNDNWEGIDDNPNRIGLFLWKNLYMQGTEQRPIIWTSDAQVPAANDWETLWTGTEEGLVQVQNQYNLFEYALQAFAVRLTNTAIENNILRYTEVDSRIMDPARSLGLFISGLECHVYNNELHNNTHAVLLSNNCFFSKKYYF